MWTLIEKLLDASPEQTPSSLPSKASSICMKAVVNVVVNFIARDPQALSKETEWDKFESITGNEKTYISLILTFVQKVIKSEQYDLNDKLEVHRLMIAMLENVDCSEHLPIILSLLLNELTQLCLPYPKNELSIYLQTLAMCFFNNSGIVLNFIFK